MISAICPSIRKANLVIGRTLTFRNSQVSDAAFILSLRSDEKKSRYLSAVTAELSAQQKWLESYELSQGQAYFIIEYKRKCIGTVRLYDQHQSSFCWGSWILMKGSPTHAAIESALMVYSYALDDLGFKAAHFDVRKGNESVWKFHERFGAKRSTTIDNDYLYTIDFQSIQRSRTLYSRFLPREVTVIR
jgi:RimJ/RimL family protein N-acetyltransferase